MKNSKTTSLMCSLQVGEPLVLHRGANWAAAFAKAGELLGRVRIPDAQARVRAYPHQMSGGQRQRAMIAMALACQPRLIIADEPTTALDVTVQAQILALLKELTRETGAALILITHDLGVVARYADRVAVMYGGRMVETASARDLYKHPLHPYTRGLLASIPRLDAPTGQKLRPIEGQPPDLARMPAGCAFQPRCQVAQPDCTATRPAMTEARPQHWKACFVDAA